MNSEQTRWQTDAKTYAWKNFEKYTNNQSTASFMLTKKGLRSHLKKEKKTWSVIDVVLVTVKLKDCFCKYHKTRWQWTDDPQKTLICRMRST